ncbi:MAG: class I SAM-dependent methyltransferase [Candidatus Latescibacterota bacterium]|nr:MAG: class I SAM-dependent methyltransferase [Candidatus Latescibacterota bacterium]
MELDRYHMEFLLAFVRGRTGRLDLSDPDALLKLAGAAGLRVHRFKRTMGLPRVDRVLGVLAGLAPAQLLDIGSGRGTFLWPLMERFPTLPVVAIDSTARRAADLGAVRRGGIERLSAAQMDTTQLGFARRSFDVVTLLEVLEHLENPAAAATEAIRVARRFVLASVPSKEDDNPEHRWLFDRRSMEALFRDGGAQNVRIDYVRGHMIAVARV